MSASEDAPLSVQAYVIQPDCTADSNNKKIKTMSVWMSNLLQLCNTVATSLEVGWIRFEQKQRWEALDGKRGNIQTRFRWKDLRVPAHSKFSFRIPVHKSVSIYQGDLTPPPPLTGSKVRDSNQKHCGREGVIYPLLPAETPPILLPFRTSSFHV